MSAESEVIHTASNLRQEADYLDADADQAEANARRNVDLEPSTSASPPT